MLWWSCCWRNFFCECTVHTSDGVAAGTFTPENDASAVATVAAGVVSVAYDASAGAAAAAGVTAADGDVSKKYAHKEIFTEPDRMRLNYICM